MRIIEAIKFSMNKYLPVWGIVSASVTITLGCLFPSAMRLIWGLTESAGCTLVGCVVYLLLTVLASVPFFKFAMWLKGGGRSV